MKINKKLIQELVNCLSEHKLSELEYSEKDIKIKVARNYSTVGNKVEILNESKDLKEKEKVEGTEIKSPIIGTAYLAPEPGGKRFVEVGKKIKKGDTVMIVEAMKTMNHVPSTHSGIVKKVSVEDGQPVEYDQILILVE